MHIDQYFSMDYNNSTRLFSRKPCPFTNTFARIATPISTPCGLFVTPIPPSRAPIARAKKPPAKSRFSLPKAAAAPSPRAATAAVAPVAHPVHAPVAAGNPAGAISHESPDPGLFVLKLASP
jgi:hypothetical protein